MTAELYVPLLDTAPIAERLPLDGRRIAVIGMGYVGLPTALSLADRGAAIVGCDISEVRLADIKSGRVDMLPREHARLTRHLINESLELTTEPSAVAEADAVIICVPTPVDSHQTPDLTALATACANVVEHAVRGQTIVLTSTTYAGCTRDLLIKPLTARGFEVGTDVYVAFSPERIDPGVEAHAPEATPRVVGGATPQCADRAVDVLQHTSSGIHPVSSPETAEMTKLLENTFRAVNIALANEFSDAARELEVDIVEVIGAAATKPYGFMPFWPGAGVGGHCIPCDPHYLLWQLRARRVTAPLIEAAMKGITTRPRQVAALARETLGDSGRSTAGANILVLGVTYKPGVADLRESPALEIIDDLRAAGAEVEFWDPYIEVIQTADGCLPRTDRPAERQWDLVIVHTNHPTEDHAWLATQKNVLDMTFRTQPTLKAGS